MYWIFQGSGDFMDKERKIKIPRKWKEDGYLALNKDLIQVIRAQRDTVMLSNHQCQTFGTTVPSLAIHPLTIPKLAKNLWSSQLISLNSQNSSCHKYCYALFSPEWLQELFMIFLLNLRYTDLIINSWIMIHGCHWSLVHNGHWSIMTLFYVIGLQFGVTFHYIISTHEITTQNKS